MKIALPARAKPFVDGRLPEGVEAAWYGEPGEAGGAATEAEVAWLDLFPPHIGAALDAGRRLRWVSTMFAGVGTFPLGVMRERGIAFTNGAGLHNVPVAEYAVMGMLAAAKNLRAIIHSQDRREWLADAPGKAELFETKALILGYGQIGRAIGERLRPFGVEVIGVRRRAASGEAGVLGPDAWRARLPEFDWIILAAALTADTRHLLGPAELAQLKPTAWIINIARGGLIDQKALIAAASRGAIGGAFLDVTDPEPAPAADPIWSTPNVLVTSHASGRAQTRTTERAAGLFLENFSRYRDSQKLVNTVDLTLGY
ncbi:MAG TPA: D-2-hydroxyacid dehydrogenase [Steroidobacteraceae bacterium]|nr:D-2-hydroxyacid dehydrogenase [Steroidobacteraceae bacterium]